MTDPEILRAAVAGARLCRDKDARKATITVTFEIDKSDDEPRPVAYEGWLWNTLEKWAIKHPREVLDLYGLRSVRLSSPRPKSPKQGRP